MSIFISTGVAEPRTMVKHLCLRMPKNIAISSSSGGHLGTPSPSRASISEVQIEDLLLGWVASEAITEGLVESDSNAVFQDTSPDRVRQIPIDVAIVQVTPPNEAGYCSLGVAVDVAQLAMSKRLCGRRDQHQIPVTLGDTFVPLSNFDLLVRSTEPPFHFPGGLWMTCSISWRPMWLR